MRSFFSLFCALCSGVFVAADFTKPDSSQGDFYQSWRVGDTVDISWNAGWNWGKGAQPDVADLFVMWFDHPTQFSQLVLANVSLSTSGKHTWKIDVPNDKVAQEPKFVLRFSQHTQPEVFDMDLPKMPSRGFILNQKAATTSSTASSTATKTQANTSTASSVASGSPSSTSGSDSSSSTGTSASNATPKKKRNTAAIAAGVLGALVGIAIVLGGLLFLLRQARKRREAASGGGQKDLALEEQKGGHTYAYHSQELPDASPSELPVERHGQPRELNGSTPREWH